MEQEQSDEEQTQNEQVAAAPAPAETETTPVSELTEPSQVDTSEQTSQTETVVAQGDERNFLAPVVLISLIIAGVVVLAVGKSLAR